MLYLFLSTFVAQAGVLAGLAGDDVQCILAAISMVWLCGAMTAVALRNQPRNLVSIKRCLKVIEMPAMKANTEGKTKIPWLMHLVLLVMNGILPLAAEASAVALGYVIAQYLIGVVISRWILKTEFTTLGTINFNREDLRNEKAA